MKYVVSVFISLMSMTAMAKEGGNGGGAFVCRDTKGKILSAELVDFYEGTSEYKLLIKKSGLSIEDQVNKAIVKYIAVSAATTQEFMESVETVQQLMNVVPNAKLENTNDFELRVSPKSCTGGKVKFEQLANYTDDEKLTVDQEIYGALSETDKAGLVIHEASYLLARKWHDVVSSREARRLTAHLFSTMPSASIPKDVLAMKLIDANSNKKWLCSSLVVGAEYEKVTIDYKDYLVKKKVAKKVVTAYGTDLFKASAALDELLKKEENQPFPYASSTKIYASNFCGSDSATTILEKIEEWDWRRATSDTVIDCTRTWSQNFDCKQI